MERPTWEAALSEIPGALTRGLADRYVIEREIGSGGMATVYLVRDLRHRRMVAIKVLSPVIAEALGPDRFAREIEIAATIVDFLDRFAKPAAPNQ